VNRLLPEGSRPAGLAAIDCRGQLATVPFLWKKDYAFGLRFKDDARPLR
jgi:hypothetical protein